MNKPLPTQSETLCPECEEGECVCMTAEDIDCERTHLTSSQIKPLPAVFDDDWTVHPFCSPECAPENAHPSGGEDVCEGCVCETCGVEL